MCQVTPDNIKLHSSEERSDTILAPDIAVDGLQYTIEPPVMSEMPVMSDSTSPAQVMNTTTPYVQEVSLLATENGILSTIERNILESGIQAGAEANCLELSSSIAQFQHSPVPVPKGRRSKRARGRGDAQECKNCSTCGQELTEFRWKKKVKKLTAKGDMRWTTKVMYGQRCDRKCGDRKLDPQETLNCSEVDSTLTEPERKGGGLS